MMGEDEAGTASLVRERREAAQPIIATHGGRLFKTMGDGMFVEFPSVVAAVECALAMQRQMATSNEGALEAKRVLYRIGVHLGDVLVEGEDILGDGVNIASRLEGVADPGGVSIRAQRTSMCAGGSRRNSLTSERRRSKISRAQCVSMQSVSIPTALRARLTLPRMLARLACQSSCFPSPISVAIPNRTISSMA